MGRNGSCPLQTPANSRLQRTPDSVEKLRSSINDLSSTFGECQLVWVSLMGFTSHASTPECQNERQIVEEMMKTRRELVQNAINKRIDRKNDLLREVGSARSGSRDSRVSKKKQKRRRKSPKSRPSQPFC